MKNLKVNEFPDYIEIIMPWFRGVFVFTFFILAIVFAAISAVLYLGNLTTIFAVCLSIILVFFTYLQLAAFLNKTQVFANKNAIEIRHRPLPWLGNKRFEVSHLQEIYIDEHKNSNGKGCPLYNVMAKLLEPTDKTINIVTSIRDKDIAENILKEIARVTCVSTSSIKTHLHTQRNSDSDGVSENRASPRNNSPYN